MAAPAAAQSNALLLRMSLRSTAFCVQDEPGDPDDPIVFAPLLGRLLEEI